MPDIFINSNGNRAILTVGRQYRIDVGGTIFYFELPYGCSLVVTTKDGKEKKDPPLRHPFWKAVELWRDQGMAEVDDLCVFDPDKEVIEMLEHLGGKHYLIVGYETVGERRARLST